MALPPCRIGIPAWIAVFVLTVGLAACGDANDGAATGEASPLTTGAETTAATDTASTSAGSVSLTVRVDQSGSGGVRTIDFRCAGAADDPAGCAELEQLEGALARSDAGEVCAQVYAGPETAEVEGTLDGEPISASLSRSDACSTRDWRTFFEVVEPDLTDGS